MAKSLFQPQVRIFRPQEGHLKHGYFRITNIWWIVGWWRCCFRAGRRGHLSEWVAFTVWYFGEWEESILQRARKRFLIEGITKANALSGENGKRQEISYYHVWTLYIFEFVCCRRGDRSSLSVAPPPPPFPMASQWLFMDRPQWCWAKVFCLWNSPLLRSLGRVINNFLDESLFSFTSLNSSLKVVTLTVVFFRILLRSPRHFEAKKAVIFLILTVVYKIIKLTLSS